MGETMIRMGPAVAVVIVLFALTGSAVAWVGRTGHHRTIPWVTIRAALQLVLLGLVIGYVADRLPLVAGFVVLMSLTAARAAASRVTTEIRKDGGGRRLRLAEVGWAVLPVAVPAVLVVLLLVLAGVLRPAGLSIIPVAGIFIGNAMAVTGLAGRRAHEELRTRYGEVEAALSLGLSDRDARMLVCRDAAATTLGPSLDQTRTIGLVTIPGAFVGMVLGGAPPWEAGVMQVFVSAGILALGTVALVLTTALVADRRL